MKDELASFIERQGLHPALIDAPEPGLAAVMTEDDRDLINCLLVLQDLSMPVDELAKFAKSLPRYEAIRTALILPDGYTELDRTRWVRDGAELFSQTLPFTEYLDSHMRPERVCTYLTEAGTDAPNQEAGLLFEDDFISQTAISQYAGKVNAITHLAKEWATGASPRMSMILAPAGFGKSKLTHILAKRLAKIYAQGGVRKPSLPFLIPFGTFRRSTSFEGLILSSLARHGRPLLTLPAFQYLVGRGRVLFILDGYDEMLEAMPETAKSNIAEFISMAGPLSRIILTSRTLFYRSSGDVVSMVGDPNLVESDVELLELQAFDKAQAKEFILRKLDRVGDRSRRVERAQELIERDAGGFGIYGSPFFLSEFVELIRGDKFSIAGVGTKAFLDFLVEVAYKRERERQGHGFSDDEQRRFLEAIALDMLQTGAAYYAPEDLEVFALEAINSSQETVSAPDPEGRRRVSKLFSHHFLSTEEGQVGSSQAATIRHQVWRDYYQGTSLARALVPALSEALLVLNRRDLSDGVARSVVAAIGTDLTVPQQFVAKLNDVGLRNVLRLLSAAVPIGDGQQLRTVPSDLSERLTGRNLRDVTISGLDLRGKDLRNTNLSGALFSNCDLRNVAWDGALLSGTTLVGCSVDLRVGAATNASCKIDETEYFGPQLADRWADSTLTDITNPAQMRETQEDYVVRVIAGRLAKFYRGGRLDSAISWTAFMGGLPAIDRDFVIRRVVKALKTEGFVAEDPGVAGSRPPFILTGDVARRHDVLLLIHDGVVGESMQAVCERLVRKT